MPPKSGKQLHPPRRGMQAAGEGRRCKRVQLLAPSDQGLQEAADMAMKAARRGSTAADVGAHLNATSGGGT